MNAPGATSPVAQLRMAFRYARGLPRFFGERLDQERARTSIRAQLEDRERSFLDVLRRGVFDQAGSPYRALARHAGLEYGDVVALVGSEGVEGALERMCERGVYVTQEEFSGRRPIRRPGLELNSSSESFRNPLVKPTTRQLTGGSRGDRRTVLSNFENLAHDAAYTGVFMATFGLLDRPAALWRPVPPSRAGIQGALYSAKLGRPLERWFSQNRLGDGGWRELLMTRYTLLASRMSGVGLPTPEHVPLGEAVRVARWLAEKCAAGTPAWINAPASSGVRVCLAATEHGLDISGTVFRFGGEPLTQGKADVVAETGSRVVCFYSMSEAGRIGLPCAEPEAIDDVHVLTDKIAVIQRDRPVGGDGVRVGALLHTTLRPSARTLMLNAESGDYGVLVERACGCPLDELGFKRHLHTIRSYDKLTTEGMTFLGDDLIRLLEDTLPSRFGGRATDYQLVEEEQGGLAKVSLLVSPSVGPVDERALLEAVDGTLRSGARYRTMMAEIWRDGETMRVVRRDPYPTAAAKVLPLHILRRPEAELPRS